VRQEVARATAAPEGAGVPSTNLHGHVGLTCSKVLRDSDLGKRSARGVRNDGAARRRSQQPLARSVHGAFFSLFFVKFNTGNHRCFQSVGVFLIHCAIVGPSEKTSVSTFCENNRGVLRH
jgi:hypothetical protein